VRRSSNVPRQKAGLARYRTVPAIHWRGSVFQHSHGCSGPPGWPHVHLRAVRVFARTHETMLCAIVHPEEARRDSLANLVQGTILEVPH
jgi:hypothetical protein